MRTFFTEFCDNSTIHGIRYFTERRRHWSERLWWILTFGLSFWLCGSSIQNIWWTWNEYPVIVRFTEKEMPISMIPFPTVEICPQTKFLKEKLDFLHAFSSLRGTPENMSKIELSRLEAVLNVCPSPHVSAPQLQNNFSNSSIYKTIEDVAPSFRRTFFRCAFQAKNRLCSEIFTPTFTQNGFCFVFNALNSHEMYTNEMSPDMMNDKLNRNVSNWGLENGYNDEVEKWHYPIRMYNSKKNGALYVTLRLMKPDLEYVCSGIIQGFRVTLSVPGEMYHTSGRFYEALLSERTEIIMKPKMITTSKKLHNYEPNQRLCFFNFERQLRFFKMYTKNNCEAECLANFTKNECGCVKFSMPRDSGTKICGMARIRCYKNVEQILFGEDVIDGLNNYAAKSFRKKCNCLPSCTSILYDADIDRSKFDWLDMQKYWSLPYKDVESLQPAVLSIYFAYPYVITLQRTESYSFTDFLAICGGLLGLFLGVSMLSIVEFIYYSTLRLFWTMRRSKTERTSKKNIITNHKIDYKSRSNRISMQNPYKIPIKHAQFRSGLNQLILSEITSKPLQISPTRVGFKIPTNTQKIE